MNEYDGATIVIANVDGETFADGSTHHSYDIVCDTYGDGDDDSRSLPIAVANARLIATTPDLLATIKAMLKLHEAHHNNPLHAQARAILAKAEGK